MDMSGMSYDPALANLPISDPQCIAAAESCIAFYAAENASQAATPWAGQFEYGHWVTYTWISVLLLASAIHFSQRWLERDEHVDPGLCQTKVLPSFSDRIRAVSRYLTYRRPSSPFIQGLGPLSWGMFSFLTLTTVFVLVLVFAERPYYRPHLGYGSPPIAIRTGLMAFAFTPISLALAGKFNFVTYITGISYERLNILHQWIGWITFLLGLIHAIPFLVASTREGSANGLRAEFYQKSMPNEMSGTPALAILFGLCLLSLTPIRRRFHQLFYYSHVLLAITYLGLIFWHSYNTLDSWAYLWATAALWTFSLLGRAFWKTQPLAMNNTWFSGSPTTLTYLPGSMTKIEVSLLETFNHKPGQHSFLRIPNLSLASNHPFTIVTAPLSQSNAQGTAMIRPQTLIFLARQRAGFTKALAQHKPIENCEVWLDGPYGGVSQAIEHTFDHLILVAGGTGITACVPWLSYLANLKRSSTDKAVSRSRIRRVTLLWTMRASVHFTWVSQLIQEAVNRTNESSSSKLEVALHFLVSGHTTPLRSTSTPIVTRSSSDKTREQTTITSISHDTSPTSKENATDDIEGTADDTNTILAQSCESQMAALGTLSNRQPVSETLTNTLQTHAHANTFVLGCGPASMMVNLANTCASMQRDIFLLKGRRGLRRLDLHIESFSV